MADPKYLTADFLTRVEIARLFSKIRVDQRTGCWLWTGCLSTSGGYGKIMFRERNERAHRVIWAWLVGPLPRGLGTGIPQLDHFVCNTEQCCFPAHLRMVSARENVLRSETSPPAINARKTHCSIGHELPNSNVGTQGRRCPICYQESERIRAIARARPRKTHCINGHLLPSEPNATHGLGYRFRLCLQCRRDYQVRRNAKRRRGRHNAS